MADFGHVTRALESFVTRPAVARGLDIPRRAQ
jgi:GSH-dependent disulfide-bond oxidoreductase